LYCIGNKILNDLRQVKRIGLHDERIVANTIGKAYPLPCGLLFETGYNLLYLRCDVNTLRLQVDAAGLNSVDIQYFSNHLVEPRSSIPNLIEQVLLTAGKIILLHLDEMRQPVDVSNWRSQVVRENFDKMIFLFVQVREFLIASFQFRLARFNVKPLR